MPLPQNPTFRTAHWILPDGEKVLPFDVPPHERQHPAWYAFVHGYGTSTFEPVEVLEVWKTGFVEAVRLSFGKSVQVTDSQAIAYYGSIGSPEPETQAYQDAITAYGQYAASMVVENPVGELASMERRLTEAETAIAERVKYEEYNPNAETVNRNFQRIMGAPIEK